MSEFIISLLGTFDATLNNEPLDSFRTKSVQALLAYLVCEAKRPSFARLTDKITLGS